MGGSQLPDNGPMNDDVREPIGYRASFGPMCGSGPGVRIVSAFALGAEPRGGTACAMIHVVVSKVAMWLLGELGNELLSVARERLLVAAGLATKEPSSQEVLEQYSQLLEDRLTSQILNRLDQDRISRLSSGFAQLKAAAKSSKMETSYLASAAERFFDIANLPQVGTTAGLSNGQLRSLANLGIAAIHTYLDEAPDEIAEGVAEGIYADPETARVWLGDEMIDKIMARFPPPPEPASTGELPEPVVAAGGQAVVSSGYARQRFKDALAAGTREFGGRNLAGLDLSGLRLSKVLFNRADLRRADLSHAVLSAGTGFWSREVAYFYNADLSEAILADVQADRAQFSGAKLIKISGNGARLRSADLNGADLTEADLTSADLSEANCREANFRGAVLAKALCVSTFFLQANLQGADLTRATLRSANLNALRAEGARLDHVIAPQASFVGAWLIGCSLCQADLQKASFERARLGESLLHGADLRTANLQEADLEGADLSEADLSEAYLGDLDLRRTNLARAKLVGARFNERTLWPSGLDPIQLGAIHYGAV
jgi:uncharacterized protein YjbI with pentapeptide repeats